MYNQFGMIWINQLIQHDYNDKLIDLMDIKLLNEKLVKNKNKNKNFQFKKIINQFC